MHGAGIETPEDLGMKAEESGIYTLVCHLERELQKCLKESEQSLEEARTLLNQRLSQVHALQEEVGRLREQLAESEQTEPLHAEIERLHHEVEVWRNQHASLHAAWQTDRRLLEEWQRRWSERQRVGQLAQQVRRTREGSGCS
jgi:DNA repair ATPase RecN